jgi:hypothetical protein
MRRARLSRLPAVLTLAAILVAFPLGALASHDFADVPDSNIFHADISALVDSGVTSGCGGGNYCPSANVTREQMAAFLNRLGALAPGKTPVVNADRLDGLDSPQLARTDQTQHFTCLGSDMTPGSNSVGYAGFGSRGLISGSGGAIVTCAVHLPDGATVTGLTADVHDNSADYELSCGLARFAPGQYVPGDMAVTTGTGNVETPGDVPLTDASITDPVIDNVTHGYAAWCGFTGVGGPDLMVYKVTVAYVGAP